MDTIEAIEQIQKDIKNLKLKAFAPDKACARMFLRYLSWEEDNARENFEAIYVRDLEIINEWLEIYCREYSCSKEAALLRIIED